MFHRRRPELAALAAGLALTVCAPLPSPPSTSSPAPAPAGSASVDLPTAIAPRGTALATLTAGAHAYELLLGPCSGGTCPWKVSLVSGWRVTDEVTLPVASSSDDASAEKVGPLWGADPGLRAWTTGGEGRTVATVARLVALGPSSEGVLVTQRYGFDVLKRHHVLLVRAGEKLQRAWEAEEPEGPTFSATAVLSEPGGAQWVAWWAAQVPLAGGDPDTVTVQRVAWTAASDGGGALTVTPLPDAARPLFLAVAGVYATVPEALAARAATAACLEAFFVLAGAAYPGLAKGKAVVAAVEVDRSRAQSLVDAAAGCGVAGHLTVASLGGAAP